MSSRLSSLILKLTYNMKRCNIVANRHFYALNANVYRSIHTSLCIYGNNEESSNILQQDIFKYSDRDKDGFLDIVESYRKRLKKTGHVEFIYVALKYMEEFGVHKDLEVYRKLIDVLPPGRFVPRNLLQAEFFHYPRHQEVIIDLLQQMEQNGVIPDWRMEGQLVSIFGKRGFPVRRYWRMMYWMPKFKNVSPWPVPKPPPENPLELAKMAISRISDVDLETQVSCYKTSEIEDAIDDTWVVSAQSPFQKWLIENHPDNVPIYIEGKFTVWLRTASINYFIMRSDVNLNRKRRQWGDIDDIQNLHTPLFMPPRKNDIIPWLTVHEQEDGNIYGIVATGTSSKDSLLSWVRLLQKHDNPRLQNIPIIFRLHNSRPHGEEEYKLLGDRKEADLKAIKDS